ncbi:hypothetical protein JTB14_037576 [Gonioctena quinquepunctata]|nr:hypothetical protein JTB14_037576 [Gonioctena quinquepunctata]
MFDKQIATEQIVRHDIAMRISNMIMYTIAWNMEADTIHASIERAKKQTIAAIEVPHDWCNFIKSVRRNPPLEVVEMEQKYFLHFDILLKTPLLVHLKINEDREPVP